MNFDLFLGGNTLLDKEESKLLPEVTLKLDNDSLFLVLNARTVAMEHFLEGTEEFFVVQVILQALDDSKALAACALLVVQMNHIVLALFLLEVRLVLSSEVNHF